MDFRLGWTWGNLEQTPKGIIAQLAKSLWLYNKLSQNILENETMYLETIVNIPEGQQIFINYGLGDHWSDYGYKLYHIAWVQKSIQGINNVLTP